MSTKTAYQTNPVVSCGNEEDGAILFNPDTNISSIINLTGVELWTFLEKPHTINEIADHIVQTYQNVTVEQATEDAESFIEALGPDFLLKQLI